MQNESGYEGEEWGSTQKNTTKEDKSVLSEILDICKESFVVALISTIVLFSPFLITDYRQEILKLFTFEKIVLFGTFIFAICAFWASHNKERIPKILEFKEPKLPKE